MTKTELKSRLLRMDIYDDHEFINNLRMYKSMYFKSFHDLAINLDVTKATAWRWIKGKNLPHSLARKTVYERCLTKINKEVDNEL